MRTKHMICLHPTDFGHGPAACGQCTNCRINHKLRWMGRMALEQKYSFPGMPGAFITLTYDDENLPRDGSLKRKDIQNFIDAIRRNIGTTERYFAVGEYGSRTFRPHFHVIHFGAYGNERWEKLYKACWKHGYIQVGSAEGAVHNYVTGYVTKKLDHLHQLEIEDRGLVPEFFSCSRRPPLGDAGLKAIAAMLNTEAGAVALAKHGFPRGYNLNGRYYPFFRRDRLKVVKLAGYDSDKTEEYLQAVDERSWFYLEEMELFRNAEVFQWSAEKLHLELEKLKEDQTSAATEKELQSARARAAKFRRRQQKERHLRSLDS